MRIRFAFVLPIAAALSVILPSCAFARQEINDPVDAAAFAELQPGTSTAEDAVRLLGAPTDVVQLGRRSAYRWDAQTTKSAITFLLVFNMANQDTRQDRVWLFFDENGQLTHKGGTFSMHRAQYAAIWEDVHEPEDNAAADADRPGLR